LVEVLIRKYSEEDRASCRGLWEELTVRHREIYDDPTIGGDDPGLYFDKHLAQAGPEHIFVATEEGAIVGLSGYLVNGNEACVEPLVVRKSRRGRGIGTMLLEAVGNDLDKTAIKYLTVKPAARNVEALEFFRKRGFDKLGMIELFQDFSGTKWRKDAKLLGMEFEY